MLARRYDVFLPEGHNCVFSRRLLLTRNLCPLAQYLQNLYNIRGTGRRWSTWIFEFVSSVLSWGETLTLPGKEVPWPRALRASCNIPTDIAHFQECTCDASVLGNERELILITELSTHSWLLVTRSNKIRWNCVIIQSSNKRRSLTLRNAD